MNSQLISVIAYQTIAYIRMDTLEALMIIMEVIILQTTSAMAMICMRIYTIVMTTPTLYHTHLITLSMNLFTLLMAHTQKLSSLRMCMRE